MKIKTKSCDVDQQLDFFKEKLSGNKRGAFLISLPFIYLIIINWNVIDEFILEIIISVIWIIFIFHVEKHLFAGELRGEKYYYVITDEVMKINWSNGKQVRYPWTTITKFRELENQIELYITTEKKIIISDYIFKSSKDRKKFYDLVREKCEEADFYFNN